MHFSMEWMRDRYSVMMRSVEPGCMDGLKGHNFDRTVRSRSNFYWSFRMPFSMQWMWGQYWVMMRSGAARLDGRFESAITFDRTVGSRSNFY